MFPSRSDSDNSKIENTFHRLIGKFKIGIAGPSVICTAGIHGNEQAGLFALKRVIRKLESQPLPFRGELVAIAGNLPALSKGIRYIEKDLNRIWSSEKILESRSDNTSNLRVPEYREQQEILAILEETFAHKSEGVYFLDLHTTSANSVPFAILGDTSRNRAFAMHFRVPIILGIEEAIDGSLLEYVNNLGHVTIGLEGGQHCAPASIDHLEAAVWIALITAGNISREDLLEADQYYKILAQTTSHLPRVLEVRYRHAINPGDMFQMEPNYTNLQEIEKGQLLARDRRGEIRAKQKGRILLPLYQGLGDDGFFIVREISPLSLKFSALLRRLHIGEFVDWLPGVRCHPERDNAVMINPRIARWFAIEFFHLLGFRKHKSEAGMLDLIKRDGGSCSAGKVQE